MGRVKKKNKKRKPIAAGSTHTKDTGGFFNSGVAATTRALKEKNNDKKCKK